SLLFFFFFFSSRRRHTRFSRDWSSDVCSSDLELIGVRPMPASDASPAVAVERALNILEAAANRRDGMTNSEISRKLAIPKSSASYILRTLERRGYLRREAETGRYRLGLKILSLGGDAQANLDIADVALPFMRMLGEKIRM